MHLDAAQKLSRYSKASRALLVDYINAHNGVSFKDDELVLGSPTLLDSAGKSSCSIALATSTGLSQDPGILTYWRVDLSTLPGVGSLVIHTATLTDEAILAAIEAQYGLYLESALVTLAVEGQPLGVAIIEDELTGFEPGSMEWDWTVDEPNMTYRLSFSPEHYLFYGSVLVHVRPSLTLLATTIDSRLDLRTFYQDGNHTLPQVDLLIPHGELYVTDALYETPLRMKLEAALYSFKTGEILSSGTLIPNLLKDLTGDTWVLDPTHPQPFNLYGATVVYNGAVTEAIHPKDPAYGYILVLALGSACNNLTGTLKIGYRYSSSQIPGNQLYDHSHIPPIFVR